VLQLQTNTLLVRLHTPQNQKQNAQQKQQTQLLGITNMNFITELDDLLVCLAAYQEDEADALWLEAKAASESFNNAKFDKWFFGGMKSDLL